MMIQYPDRPCDGSVESSLARCRPETGAHIVYNGAREWHEPCPRHQPTKYAERSAASGGAKHKGDPAYLREAEAGQ